MGSGAAGAAAEAGPGPWDIVVANILAPVLLQAAPALARALSRRPGHALVLSGILASQYPDVKAAFAAHGLHERATLVAGDWQSGVFGDSSQSEE